MQSSIAPKDWAITRNLDRSLNISKPLAQTFGPNLWPLRGLAYLKAHPI